MLRISFIQTEVVRQLALNVPRAANRAKCRGSWIFSAISAVESWAQEVCKQRVLVDNKIHAAYWQKKKTFTELLRRGPGTCWVSFYLSHLRKNIWAVLDEGMERNHFASNVEGSVEVRVRLSQCPVSRRVWSRGHLLWVSHDPLRPSYSEESTVINPILQMGKLRLKDDHSRMAVKSQSPGSLTPGSSASRSAFPLVMKKHPWSWWALCLLWIFARMLRFIVSWRSTEGSVLLPGPDDLAHYKNRQRVHQEDFFRLCAKHRARFKAIFCCPHPRSGS